MAVAAFIAAARDRGNWEATVYKKHVVFESALLRFRADQGIRFVSELDLNTVREWRSGWNLESLSRSKRQGQVIGFLWFCERTGWPAPKLRIGHHARPRQDSGEGYPDRVLSARRIQGSH
jgi:hypothetical protein